MKEYSVDWKHSQWGHGRRYDTIR